MLVRFAVLALGLSLSAAAPSFAQPEGDTHPALTEDHKTLALIHVDNRQEVDLAALVAQKATRDDVRDYAEMLGKDHGEADVIVREFAAAHGFVPGTLALQFEEGRAKIAKGKALKETLEGLDGEAFDTAYLEAMRDEHANAIATLETALTLMTEADLKTFVTGLLPKLQHHKEQAEQLLGAHG